MLIRILLIFLNKSINIITDNCYMDCLVINKTTKNKTYKRKKYPYHIKNEHSKGNKK